MVSQLELKPLIAEAFKNRRAACLAYMAAHKNEYAAHAALITPDLYASNHVWGRAAFAILSARELFPVTCAAFVWAFDAGSDWVAEMPIGETEAGLKKAGVGLWRAKARYLRALALRIRTEGHTFLIKGGTLATSETWAEYARRLEEIPGLGTAKARFLACLLYPLVADLACVDTWMVKVFLQRNNGRVNRGDYLRVEKRIRAWGKIAGTRSTFLAQWMCWDHARGHVETHGVLALPGGHKGWVEPIHGGEKS